MSRKTYLKDYRTGLAKERFNETTNASVLEKNPWSPPSECWGRGPPADRAGSSWNQAPSNEGTGVADVVLLLRLRTRGQPAIVDKWRKSAMIYVEYRGQAESLRRLPVNAREKHGRMRRMKRADSGRNARSRRYE